MAQHHLPALLLPAVIALELGAGAAVVRRLAPAVERGHPGAVLRGHSGDFHSDFATKSSGPSSSRTWPLRAA